VALVGQQSIQTTPNTNLLVYIGLGAIGCPLASTRAALSGSQFRCLSWIEWPFETWRSLGSDDAAEAVKLEGLASLGSHCDEGVYDAFDELIQFNSGRKEVHHVVQLTYHELSMP
jgi:hypothetical protein